MSLKNVLVLGYSVRWVRRVDRQFSATVGVLQRLQWGCLHLSLAFFCRFEEYEILSHCVQF